MKLQGLIVDLSLIFILVFKSKGQQQQWRITVPERINTTLGSDLTIPCNFTYPQEYHTENVTVYWKLKVKSIIKFNDKDTNAFIYHTNDTFVLEKYRNKTKLIGDKTKGNCSIMILDIKESVQNIYVRIAAKDNYSFIKKPVFISVANSTPVNDTSTNLTFTTTEATNMFHEETVLYVTTFVPVAALLIIIIVTGIFCYIKHKRSHPLTREESGYYANFSRASSNQAKSEVSCKTHKDKELPELKVIEEPVYINTEVLTIHKTQSLDHKEHIYGNVDYSQ